MYPNHDSSKLDSDSFVFTYLKCLPSFRGVSLALTENSRISLDSSFFSVSDKKLDSIDLKINNEFHTIPLSKGINAIIGDNSIGKSLLIHKITDYYRKDYEKDTSSLNDEKICIQYDNYLKRNGVEIISRLSQDNIYGFDSQGEIRKKFALNKLKTTTFFEKRHKENIHIEQIRTQVETYVKNYINRLKQFKNLENTKSELSKLLIQIPLNDVEAKVLKFTNYDTNEYNSLKNELTLELNKFKTLKSSIIDVQNYLDEQEKKKMNEFLSYVNVLLEKRESKLDMLENKINTIELINSEIQIFNSKQINTTADKIIQKFNNQIESVAQTIKNLLLASDKKNEFANPSLSEPLIIPAERFICGDLKIVTCSDIHIIDNEYLLNLLSYPLKKGCFKMESFTSDVSLANAISRHNQLSDPWEEYETLVINKMKSDIKESIKLNRINEDDYVDHSAGLNDRMYFEILSKDEITEGVYIIDQPEDDISQKAIRDNLIACLRTMGKNRQVILITHNPQFVVNLDVDNVIYLHKNESGLLDYHSGALEYKDERVDILNDVAETLDGGVLTIRKRWKKYEKNIEDMFD